MSIIKLIAETPKFETALVEKHGTIGNSKQSNRVRQVWRGKELLGELNIDTAEWEVYDTPKKRHLVAVLK